MIKIETTLKQLNAIFVKIGTWQAVADGLGYNRATINKWFTGKRVPSYATREYIAYVHRKVCGRAA